MMVKQHRAVLLIWCQDNKGITAAVTNFIASNNGNIIHADQHIDEQTKTFFMRIEWMLDGFAICEEKILDKFSPIAEKFQMDYNLYFSDQIPAAAIFVSRHMHCLYDLLLRHKEGHFNCRIPIIISNHTDAKPIADTFGIKFYHIPITKENKLEQEKKELDILHASGIDILILARYHQILTGSFVDEFPNRIINIHHSFLPAFAGSDPYGQAYRKGVKIIGATSHYVTEQLDQGPIISQDVVKISHRESLQDIIRKGQDLEKIVLSRAVQWHLERKILVYNNKTVVFN